MPHPARTVFVFALALAVAALAPRGARADAPSLSWTRGAGADACPSRERVLADFERTLGAPLERALAGRSLEALVTRGDDGWQGTLWWRRADGSLLLTRALATREGTCDEFSRALLASALVALDTSLLPEAGAPRAAPPPAPPPPTPTPPPAPAPPQRRLRAGDVALGGVLAGGWIAGTAYGMQLFVEPLVYGRLRIGAVVTALAENAPAASTPQANFAAVEFGADACGTFLRVPHAFEIAACGGLRAGAVQSFSYEPTIPTGGNRVSFATQAALSIRVTPPIPLVIGIEPALRWNVTRYELLAADRSTVLFTQDLIGATLVLRVGVQLP